MSRYAKRFWQMNAAQKAKAQAIEARHAPWRSAAIKALYVVTPRWFLWTLIIVMFVLLLLGDASSVSYAVGKVMLAIMFFFFGTYNLLQGWSFLGRGRVLLTGILNALLGILFIIGGTWMLLV